MTEEEHLRANAEAAAAIVESSPDFRVLRRLRLPDPLSLGGTDISAKRFPGLFVDVETTGLDPREHEAVELCMWPFMFDVEANGARSCIAEWGTPRRMLQQPASPMPAAMTAIHGLTDEDLRGQVFDQVAIGELLGYQPLVICHHSQFDRAFLEKAAPAFAKATFACSMDQVPWKANGMGSNGLEYLCLKFGAFYDAHHATDDCRAGLFLLTQTIGGKTALQWLIEATRVKSVHVFAYDSPFDSKDLLKARGYKWRGDDSGLPKCWHKMISQEEQQAEWDWLHANVYSHRDPLPAEFRLVGAVDRFTDRG